MPNFFDFYDDYTKDTEPPPNFHAWSAMGALSALLGKKCYIPQGSFTVFPNTYIVLVGTPGTRKTSAMNIAKRLVRLVEKVPIAPESSTREALIDEMSGNKVVASYKGRDISYWQSSAFVSELQEFLGGKHINASMVGFLTAIWDESIFKERTRKGGEVVIHNPFFSMLGCCTPGWMNEKLKQDVITDGFSRRTIFALEEELNTLNPWPVSSPEQLEQLTLLSNEAKRVAEITGEFILSKKAYEYYAAKYIATREEAKAFSEKIQSYFTSRHILALKLAMCISAGIDSMRNISEETMMLAYKFLEQSERHLDQVFAGVGRNELKAYSDKVLAFVQAAPKGVTKGDMLMQFSGDIRHPELLEIIEVLGSSGQITSAGASLQSHVQGELRFRAVAPRKSAPAVNLLKLARRVALCREPMMAESSSFALARHLDPATERLLTRQLTAKEQTGSGLLLKGKRPPVTGDPGSLSQKLDL